MKLGPDSMNDNDLLTHMYIYLAHSTQAIKRANHNQRTNLQEMRKRLKIHVVAEAAKSMEMIRTAVMSPADIAGHQFTAGPQLKLRCRYVNMTAAHAVDAVFGKACQIGHLTAELCQLCASLRGVVNDKLSCSLFQLALCCGDLSKPDVLKKRFLNSEEAKKNKDNGPDKEKSPVKSQPTEGM